jgi:hypothetical protein
MHKTAAIKRSSFALSIFALALAALLIAMLHPARAQQLDPHSSGVPVSATSGDVAATTATATLPATQNRTTFLCGFSVTGTGATATSVVAITVGNVNATTTFDLVVPAGATVTLPITQYQFSPCIPSSQINQSVTVSVPSLGSGNAHSQVTAWGYQGTF